MKVFQNPTDGTYLREDGKPGYGCALCGNGYATAETRNDVDAHGCVGPERDQDRMANERGTFTNGYTDEDIENFAADLTTVQFVCLWAERADDGDFTGDSEIIGREVLPDGSTGPWCALGPEFWEYLTAEIDFTTGEPDPTPVLPDGVGGWLGETFPSQDIYEFYSIDHGYNWAQTDNS